MKCPKCKSSDLKMVHTKQAVVVDYCETCKGVWLDEGEIFLFSKHTKWLKQKLAEGLSSPHPSQRMCPKCMVKLNEGGFLKPDLLIDQCPHCNGLWFDDGELKEAVQVKPRSFNLSPTDEEESVVYQEDSSRENRLSAIAAHLTPLPNLVFRSVTTLFLLYGLLILAFFIAADLMDVSFHISVAIAVGFIFLQYLISPFIMDFVLSWIHSLEWVDIKNLPEHLGNFIIRVCGDEKMNIPKIGIISDLTPNAFTYGHTPNNARVVITQGILHYLEPEEAEAVVGHELGHARHWDILVMTLASLVPVILYYLYRFFLEASKRVGRGRKGGEAKAVTGVATIVSYILYIIAQYIVLWLSRVREYWADRFAGKVTGDANALARALIKIAYGLVSPKNAGETEEQKERASNLQAISAMGIFDKRAAQSLALTSYAMGRIGQTNTEVDKEKMADAMQWDLWNPWALYYEIHSTHPLPAKRINALTEQAVSQGHKPYLVFKRKKPESYWDEFFIDFLVNSLPVIPLIIFLVAFGQKIFDPASYIAGQRSWWYMQLAIFLVLTSIGYLIKVFFSYNNSSGFPNMKIVSLLKKIKVSAVRPVPVTLTGKIVGRGVPGYLFSEDMTLQDDSGIIFLDYRQPLRIFEFLFAVTRTDELIGQDVTVQGWYRRAPVPYIEILKISTAGDTYNCYVYVFKIVFGILLFIGGLLSLAASKGMI